MKRSENSSGSDWRWLALLWGAACVFFWPVLFGGQSFYFRDTLTYYYPEAVVARQGLPLWCSSIGAGFPLLADPHSTAFYPLSILLHWLPMPRAYDVFTAIHSPMAASFLYLLLRRWKLERPAAALGGFAFGFSGFIVGTTCLTIVLRGVAWMPLVLLAADVYVEEGGMARLAALALAVGIQGSCTDPLYVGMTLAMAAALHLLRPVPNPPEAMRRAIAIPVYAGFWAAALLAAQLGPLDELVRLSDRNASLAQAEAFHFSLHPSQLANAALPLAYPDPAAPEYLTSFPAGEVPFFPDLYWGVPMLALAAAAFGWVRRRDDAGFARATIGWTVVALVAVAISFGPSLPFFSILTALVPPLRYIRYSAKFFVPAALAVPVLIAFGFEGLCREKRESLETYFRLLAAAAVVAAIDFITVRAIGGALPRAFLSGGKLTLGPDAGPLLAEVATRWSRNLLTIALLSSILAALAWLMRRGTLPARTVLAAVGLWAAADLSFTTVRSYPVVPDWIVTDAPQSASFIPAGSAGQPAPRFVSQSPGSVVAFDEERTVQRLFLLERELLTHFIGVAHGLDPIPRGSAVWLDSMRKLANLLDAASPADRPRLAAAVGASYSLELADTAAPDAGGTILGKSGPVIVRKLDGTLPRVFVAGRASPASRPAELPTSASLLSMPAAVEYEGADLLAPERVRSCVLVTYSDREVIVELDLEGRGLLVVADQFYPGWIAEVDGKPRPIARVAGLFRGVPVQQGDRRMVMRYEPEPFRKGVAVSLATLVLTLGLLASRMRRGRTR